MNPKRTKTVIDENHDGENRQQELCFISTGKQQQKSVKGPVCKMSNHRLKTTRDIIFQTRYCLLISILTHVAGCFLKLPFSP